MAKKSMTVIEQLGVVQTELDPLVGGLVGGVVRLDNTDLPPTVHWRSTDTLQHSTNTPRRSLTLSDTPPTSIDAPPMLHQCSTNHSTNAHRPLPPTLHRHPLTGPPTIQWRWSVGPDRWSVRPNQWSVRPDQWSVRPDRCSVGPDQWSVGPISAASGPISGTSARSVQRQA